MALKGASNLKTDKILKFHDPDKYPLCCWLIHKLIGGTIISRADNFQASFTIGNNYCYAKISGNGPYRMDIITKDLLAQL